MTPRIYRPSEGTILVIILVSYVMIVLDISVELTRMGTAFETSKVMLVLALLVVLTTTVAADRVSKTKHMGAPCAD